MLTYASHTALLNRMCPSLFGLSILSGFSEPWRGRVNDLGLLGSHEELLTQPGQQA